MPLLVFHHCVTIALFCVAVMVSAHLCVICHHFYCPMWLFQGHVACQNFTQTGPHDYINISSITSGIMFAFTSIQCSVLSTALYVFFFYRDCMF